MDSFWTKMENATKTGHFSWMSQEDFQTMMGSEYYGLNLSTNTFDRDRFDLTSCLPYCHYHHVDDMIHFGANPQGAWQTCVELANKTLDHTEKACFFQTAAKLLTLEQNS